VLAASLLLRKEKKVAVSVALGCCLAIWLVAANLPSDSYVSESLKRWEVAVFLWELALCYPVTILGET